MKCYQSVSSVIPQNSNRFGKLAKKNKLFPKKLCLKGDIITGMFLIPVPVVIFRSRGTTGRGRRTVARLRIGRINQVP